MNIISETKDRNGVLWAIAAIENKFMIVFKEPGGRYWKTNSEIYNDPDPAIKALKRRIAICNVEK